MADFEIAHKRTAIFEGGYTNDPDDNGNWTGRVKGQGRLIGTNWGISANTLEKYLDRFATVADMKNLTQATAHAIYKKNYWDAFRGDEIKDQDTANQIYDEAVNAGPQVAIKSWQKTLDISQTGIMDKFTLDKTNLA